MKKTLSAAALITVGTVGSAIVLRRIGATITRSRRERDRWHSVTVNRSPGELGALPKLLRESVEHEIEARVRPAPGGRGTELSARLLGRVPTGLSQLVARARGADPVGDLRRGLRKAKQFAELGRIPVLAPGGTTSATPAGKPLEFAIRHAREAGRL